MDLDVTVDTRLCPECAERVPSDAVVCPYCEARLSRRPGWSDPSRASTRAQAVVTDPGAVPGWLKALLILSAIFLWPLAVVVGIAMALSPHPDQKATGKMTLLVALVVGLIAILASCASLLLSPSAYYYW